MLAKSLLGLLALAAPAVRAANYGACVEFLCCETP